MIWLQVVSEMAQAITAVVSLGILVISIRSAKQGETKGRTGKKCSENQE